MSALFDFINSGRIRRACEKGATFKWEMTWKEDGVEPTDLTGYHITMQVREEYDSESVILELSDANGKVVLDEAADGVIKLLVTDEVTATLTPGTYLYDLLIESPTGEKTRLLEGKFEISDRVTR